LWKHSINKSLIENSIKLNGDTLFICLYKPIHNWICSMQKAAYGIKWNNKLTGECNFKGQNYTNIIEIYNTYYNMYMELINTYERVILLL
jgi:hypothetical protein